MSDNFRGILEKGSFMVSASDLSDESLLRYYDNIRRQVEAERDNEHKFMTSNSIKEYAESLRVELDKRRLSHTPIDWWAHQQTDAITPPRSEANQPLYAPSHEATTTEIVEEIKLADRDSTDPLNNLKSRIHTLLRDSAKPASD
jgi:hypothetical protein